MTRYRSILSHAVTALQALLLTAVVFHEHLAPPGWLMPAGRLHPLLLHFPIALALLLTAAAFLPAAWREDGRIGHALDLLWLHAAGLSALTALSGLFLSREGGYDADTLERHMWLGAATAFATYAIWATLHTGALPHALRRTAMACCALALVWGGHEGGTLTHGEGFLTLRRDETPTVAAGPVAVTDSTPIFQAALEPVLQSKCHGCHNEQKAKGDFVMTRTDLLLKGGKEGAPWVAGLPDSSPIIRRILLDPGDEKHMPPKGKAQLTPREVELLHRWIAAGADFGSRLADFPETDSFRILAAGFYGMQGRSEAVVGKSYGFPPADAATVLALNGPFRRVVPVDATAPALQLSFFVSSAYRPEMLTECRSIAQQTVSVNLSGMPAGDEACDELAGFPNLEELNLNGTRVTGKGLDRLAGIKTLRRLSLANTSVTAADLERLAPFGRLEDIRLWRSAVTAEQAAALAKKHPRVRFDVGQLPDTSERLKLTPPALRKPDKAVFARGETLELKHPMPGVTIRYTTDGSEPDSVTSPAYKGPVTVNGPTEVRAIAVLPGWYASTTSVFTVFARGIPAAKATLLTVPDSRYRVQGSASLTDGLKGESRNPLVNWLGFRDTVFAAAFRFAGRDSIRKVVLSMAENNGGYIMPPRAIEVLAGPDSATLTPVGRLEPEQPLKYGPVRNRIFTVDVKPGRYRYVRVQADPVAKLPAWHRGKGDRGWVFVDEVFFE
jgi:hypothetical protein